MITIDPRFIDVDFAREQPYVPGMLTESNAEAIFGDACVSRFEDVQDVLSESDAKELANHLDKTKGGIEWLVSRIYNQGQEGSCVANATCQSQEILQARTLGLENMCHLSAISVYDYIGRSPGSGAMVSDGIKRINTHGALPLDDERNRARFGDKVKGNTGFRSKYPSDWEPTARKFRVLEWGIARTKMELISAGLKGFPAIVGRSGHSICYTRAIWSGGWKMPYPNSWGNWGQGFGAMPTGWGFDSERSISSSAGWAAIPLSITDWRH